MEDFSLYVLDITMNSVRAKASDISVEIIENGDWLDFTVTDNGCGMSQEQVAKLPAGSVICQLDFGITYFAPLMPDFLTSAAVISYDRV